MSAFADVQFGHYQQQTSIVFEPPPSTTINDAQHDLSPTAAARLHRPQTTHSTRPPHCMPMPMSSHHVTRAAHSDDDVPHHLDGDNPCHCHCQVSLITLQPHLLASHKKQGHVAIGDVATIELQTNKAPWPNDHDEPYTRNIAQYPNVG